MPVCFVDDLNGFEVDQILEFLVHSVWWRVISWNSLVLFTIHTVLFLIYFVEKYTAKYAPCSLGKQWAGVSTTSMWSPSAIESLRPVSCQVRRFMCLYPTRADQHFHDHLVLAMLYSFTSFTFSLGPFCSCILLQLPSFSSVPFTRCDIALIEQKHVERSDISRRIREKLGVCVTGSLCLEQGVCWEWM